MLRLWIRPEVGRPLVEVDSLELVAGSGIRGDHTFGRMRHVTIVFEDDWNAACGELGRDVDPVGRRANVLISGGGGVEFLKRSVALGGAQLEIKGITAPCDVMERAAKGLKSALKPDGRAGVWGRVLVGATIERGGLFG